VRNAPLIFPLTIVLLIFRFVKPSVFQTFLEFHQNGVLGKNFFGTLTVLTFLFNLSRSRVEAVLMQMYSHIFARGWSPLRFDGLEKIDLLPR